MVNDNTIRLKDRESVFADVHGAADLRRVALWICAALTLVAWPLCAATFTASLDRNTITLGESATLSLTFEGGSPKDVPALPTIPNLEITYSGPSSQFSVINGAVSSTVTHIFAVTPRQAGDFVIPSVTAEVGGQKLSSTPLQLKVLKPSAPSPEAIASGSQDAFFRFQLPKTNVYLGEVLTGELQFYIRQGLRLAGMPRLNGIPAEGFIVGKIGQAQQRQVRVGNAAYTVISAPVPLSVVKAGPLTIGPITGAIIIESPSSNRRRSTLFEQLGVDDPFNPVERKQINVAAETVNVRSLPLPTEGVPPSFNGAVGTYSMDVTAGPTNVATGDPITVRVQITGRGALDALTLPEQNGWKNFKTYPPTSNIELTDQLGQQGTKTFEQIVTPESTDIKELPAFSFSFFDPDAKQYRTLTRPAIALIVRPGGAAPSPVVAARNNSSNQAPPPVQDIVPLKQRVGALAKVGPPLVERRWFIAVQGVPVLAWLAAMGWRKRADSLANNPRLRRQRQVAQIVRDGLAELRRHAEAKKPEEFFAMLVHLLQEQLGERLDCPASAITEAVIEEKLRPRGVAEGTLTALHELFQTCNLARYAPVQSSHELTAIAQRFESLVRELQEVKL